jgi:hypothetical protein
MSTEKIKDAVAIWLNPSLITIVGFFVVGTFNDLKELKAQQALLLQKNAVFETELRFIHTKISEHEKWLEELEKRTIDLKINSTNRRR